MFLLIPAAIGGGATTVALLWPSGSLMTVMAAPIGGSLVGAVAAGVLAWRRSAQAQLEARAGTFAPSFAEA